MPPIDWSRYPNFSRAEFTCSHTGRCDMDADFLSRMQQLRTMLGVPLVINSGFRDPSHPAEAHKPEPGAHTYGVAADVACDTRLCYQILQLAPTLGFTGLGVSQRAGRGRFVHLDTWTHRPRPNVWSY